MTAKRHSVFISYAHKDGMEFTRRLAFALSMYMDVFWDRRLQAGEYPPQLLQQIESRDYILLVMSPHSLNSEWCLRECEHAVKHKKQVVLARIFDDCRSDLEKILTSTYTYGDFVENFEAGFRGISQQMLQHPVSSWEAFPLGSDREILEALRIGLIPGLISRSITEWIVIEKLWPIISGHIQSYFPNAQSTFWGQPQTPYGVLRQCQILASQLGRDRDMTGIKLLANAQEVVRPFAEASMNINDSRHIELGILASQTIESIKELIEKDITAQREFGRLRAIREMFYFEVAEKLREFINLHARRSRYLY